MVEFGGGNVVGGSDWFKSIDGVAKNVYYNVWALSMHHIPMLNESVAAKDNGK